MRNLRKIIISVLVFMSAIFALSLTTPLEVHGEDGHVHNFDHGYCSSCGQCNGQHDNENGWTPLTSAGGTLTTGNYYLEDNLILDSGCNFVINGTVTVCLNGHVLAGSGFKYTTTKNVFTVSAGFKLNITDCNGTIYGGTAIAHHFTQQDDQEGLWVWDESEQSNQHIVYGGVITGGKNSSSGGAINLLNNTYLNIYHGNFIGNQCAYVSGQRGNGGVISTGVNSYTSIYDGYFAGNVAGSGGVYYSGSINKNYKPELKMYGGSMEYNVALRAGGAIASSSARGKNISHNYAYFLGGTIRNNICNVTPCNAYGGGVYFYGKTYFGGDIVITDNTRVTTIASGVAETEISNYYFTGSYESINNSSNTPYAYDDTYNFIDFSTEIAPKDGMNVGFSTSDVEKIENHLPSPYRFSKAITANYQRYFSSDNEDYKVKGIPDSSGKYILYVTKPTHTHISPSEEFTIELTEDVLEEKNWILSTGKYYIETNLSVTNPITIPTGTDVKLCLNGYGIIGNQIEGIFNVASGSTFELYDCQPNSYTYYFVDNDQNGSFETLVDSNPGTNCCVVNGGFITGGKSTTNNGSAINVYGGTFKMYGGTIVGNYQHNDNHTGGGALNLENSTCELYGGSFVGNYSDNGGAIRFSGTNCLFTINDCTIKKNTAYRGGAIYSSADATIEIKGGSYQYNNASGEGGGAIYTEEDTILRLIGDGDTQIDHNTTEGCGGAIYVKGEFKMIAGSINDNYGATACGVYVASCNASPITVGDNAIIWDNDYEDVQSNLYLCDKTSDKLITVVYGLDAHIGITSEKDPEDGAFVISTEANNDYHDFIISDNPSYKIIDREVNSKHVLKLAITLKVTYHPFGNYEGQQPVVLGNVPTDETDYVEEDVVTILSVDTKTFKRVGYKLLGWTDDPDSTEVLGDSFIIYENTDLYAVWQEKITITFDTSQQEYVYSRAVSYGYTIDHELANSFQIKYYLNPDLPDGYNLWGVSNVGTYDIEILRAEDTIYKGVDLYIYDAIKISPKTVTPNYISNIDDEVFTRSAIEIDASTLVIRYNDEAVPLEYGTDFIVSYENNINVGQATININGTGSYGFVTSKTFNIISKEITPTITNIETAYYSKEGSKPAVTVKDGDFTLTAGTDYTVEYSNNTSVGTGHLVVTCCGNYSGTVESDFTINKRNITPVINPIDSQTYNGNAICPDVSVYDGEYLLEKGTEYETAYSNNVQAGTAKVVVTLKGNYEGSAVANYTINPKELTITWDILEFTYDGTYHVPTASVSGAVQGDVVEISVTGKQINAGVGYIATAYFTEIQNNYVFKDNIVPSQTFVINKATTVVTDLAIANWTYGQSAKTPTASTNYGTINYSYSDNEAAYYGINPPINAGLHYVKAYVEEDDNWLYAEQVISFMINKRVVGADCCPNNFTYNGQSQIGSLYATFLDIYGNPKDLVVSKVLSNDQFLKTDFKDAGEWKVTFAFKTDEDANNYAFNGTPEYTYLIKKKYITPIITSIVAQGYTGSDICPTIQVYDGSHLVAIDDGYEVEYSNNVEVGIATVTVTMNTNYDGTNSTTFVIEPKVLTVDWNNLILTYTGFELLPTAKLVGVVEGEVVNYEVIGAGIDVGTNYVATVQFVGEHNNYKFENDVNPTQSFSIVQATSEITGLEIQNWTYKEQAEKPNADTNFGEVLYSYSKSQYNGFTNEVPTDAGDYYVKAYVEETDNWSYAEQIKAFTIYKRSITPRIDDIDDQTYSRSAITPQVFVYDGEYLLNGTTEYDVEYINNIHAGIATVNVTLKGNYDGANSINFTIKRVVLSINWSNLVITYDGQPHVPTATLVGVIPGDNVEIIITGAKTDVGTNYIASADFAIPQNDYELINSICISQAFSIVKATTVISNLSIQNWAYKDAANKPSASANFGIINFAYSKFADSGFVNEVPTEAGDYYVKAYVEETNNWSYAEKVVSFKINKRNIIPQINNIENQTYIGNEICPQVFVYDLEYLMNGETEYDVAYSNNVQAGIATVTVTLKGNYQGSNSINFTINPVVLTVEWSDLEFTYDGNEHAPTAIAVGMVNGENVAIVVTGGMIDAGQNYVATAKFATAQNNYVFENEENPTNTFNISPATTVITGLAIEDWTYGQAVNAPTANNNFGTVEYAYSKFADGGFTAEIPTEAGDYYVKAYVEETNNWSYAEQVVEFTIHKMIVTASYCEDNFTYDGTSQANKLSASYINKDNNVTALMIKSISNSDNIDTDFKEARVWNVVFTFATYEELNNYSFGESGEDSYTTFTMNKADYNMEAVAWDYEEGKFTYDETYHTVSIIPESLPEGVTVVKYSNNSFFEAGTYYASVVEFDYDKTNYNCPDYQELFEWEIGKANYDLSNVKWDYVAGKFTYDGSKKDVKLINLPESISVKYSTNEVSDSNSGVNAGEYETIVTTIYYDEVNYFEPSSLLNESCYWEIAQATTAITSLTIQNWTYGQVANKPSANTNFGTIIYKYSNSADGLYESNVPTEAGTYYVKAYVEETNNWSYAETVLEFKVNKLVVNAIFCEDNFTYDGTSQASKLSAQYLNKDSKLVSLKVKSIINVDNTDTDFKNARTWTVTFTFVSDDEVKNYSFGKTGEYTSYNYHMKKANYDMKDVAWNYQNNFVYDGTEKSVVLTNLPDGVTVAKYANNTSSTAGKFTASVVEFDYDKANYNCPEYSQTCNWEVKKATYDMSNAAWNYSLPFTYDGTEKKVEVNNLPEGVSVKSYANNAKTKAGSYEATVVFNYDITNYNEPTMKSCKWTIALALYNMNNVKWDYESAFTYDGTEKTVKVINLPEGVSASYTNNAKTIVGKYTATVTLIYDTENYEPVSFKSLDWEIKKANYDLSNVKWDYESAFTYDKTEKTIKLINLPEGVSATYAGNAMINAGTYEAAATLVYDTVNYNAPTFANCNWEIKKANYDLSNVKWDYESAFTYDGTEKTVKLINLPEGVSATYADNANSDAGAYEAVATLAYDTVNYNAPTFANCNWEIKKANYVMNVRFDSLTIPVDNQEHMIKVVGTLPEGVSVEYYCNDKVFTGTKEVGTYEVVAKFTGDYDNYNVIDSMNATLTIKATEIAVPVTEGKTVPDIKIETENGFPEDVVIEFSISTDDTEDKKTSSFDYEANKDKETKLKFNEEVGFVFELKLQREVNGVMVDLQPSDLDGVTSIKVKIHIPDDIDIDELTRIIHVHSDNDITEIEFDASKVDADRYYEIEITKLSEFAFIHKKDCYAHWGLIAILVIYIALFVVYVFVLKHHKFDIPSIVVTSIYGIAWFIFIFTACCYKCIIFAVIDFLVLIFALMLLGTNGAENLAKFLFNKKNDDKEDKKAEEPVKEEVTEQPKSNMEELKKFKENEAISNIKTESYEDKKLEEMFQRVMKDNIAPDVYDGEGKVEYVGVVFANGKKIYKYNPNGYTVKVGDKVIVEGQNGSKNGRIVHCNYYGKPNPGFIVRNIINVLNK